MENRNLNKAMEIFAVLIQEGELGAKGSYAMLYEEYAHNAEVYDMVHEMAGALDLQLYEYNDSLYVSAGSNNHVFGYTNEELKKMMGLRVNKELYLVYFIIYHILLEFYRDSANSTYLEYIRLEDIIRDLDATTDRFIDRSAGIVLEEAKEENSFKSLALMWDELPMVSKEDKSGNEARAARGSRTGYVKLTFNFMESQGMLSVADGRYYPSNRFHAIAQKYFEENRGRLYELMKLTKDTHEGE